MDDVELDILRDPDAISVNDWLKENNLTIKQIALTERRFQSLDPNILKVRGERILKKYPQIDMSWQANTLVLSGNIGVLQFEKLLSVLSIAGFTTEVNLSIDQVKHISISEFETNNAVKEQLFEALVGRITTIQLDFAVESAEISNDFPPINGQSILIYHYNKHRINDIKIRLLYSFHHLNVNERSNYKNIEL